MAKGPTTLNDSDLLDVNHRRYGINLPVGVSVDDALDPEFWAHVGKKLRPLDTIRLQAADRTFIAETVVISAGPGFAKLKLLAKYELVADVAALEAEESGESAFTVKWDSPSTKWAVIRKSDKVKLRDGFATKEDAQSFALNHQRAVLA